MVCFVVAIVGLFVVHQCGGLNTDGVLLLSFKHSVASDPLRVLDSWHYSDDTPCSWTGVTCDGFSRVTALSLPSSRLLGSIPADLGTIEHLSSLDLSYNSLNGSLPEDFGGDCLRYLNVSYNKLSGEIPPDFTKKMPSNATVDLSFNNLTGEIPDSQVLLNQETKSFSGNRWLCGSPCNRPCSVSSGGLRAGTMIGIVIAGILILSVIFSYKYIRVLSCLRREAGEWDSESSEETKQNNKSGILVTVDGDKELELEPLLKASAYILSAAGSTIMYKAVLEDGTALAVRRIGDNGVEQLRNFENQVRVMAKLVHPNLVRVRGFYWGTDEKLIIYDYVPNGSLANARYRKVGSSPCHIPWEVRLKIAKGVARGLSYLHDKKHVHGNLKPSNILLDSHMDPKIADFGLERLVTSYKAGCSARNFGSKRSQEPTLGPIPSPSPSPSPSSIGGLSPYHAPESLRSLKPNSKWDVYAFGVILLELLTGKVVVLDELGQGIGLGLGLEDKARILRMADVAIRADLEGKEEWLMACFKLGYGCASQAPQKRPQMREAVQVLDKIPSSSCSPYY